MFGIHLASQIAYLIDQNTWSGFVWWSRTLVPISELIAVVNEDQIVIKNEIQVEL